MIAVVVAALDSFSRRMLESVRCREELSALGVSVHGIREGGVVDDFITHIFMATAQQKVRRLSMRVRTAWAELDENGYFKCSSGSRGATSLGSRLPTSALRGRRRLSWIEIR